MSNKKVGWSEADRKGHRLLIVRRVVVYFVLIVMAFLTLFPLVSLVINTTRAGGDISTKFSLLPGASFVGNLKKALSNGDMQILTSLKNSIIVAAFSSILSVYFSTLTAYGLYAYNFKLKKYAFGFIMLVMMVPTQVSVIGFYRMMKNYGLLDTFIPLIIPAIAAPAVFFFIKQYMESSLPLEIVEAGRIDGGHEFYIFNALVLPIVKPAIAVQFIFTFVASWNNYFIPQLIITDKSKWTMPIFVASLQSAANDNFDMGAIFMSLAIAIIPIVIVYLIMSKSIIRGVTLGSVKG